MPQPPADSARLFWDAIRNGVEFDSISPGSHKAYWWQCEKAGHNFEQAARSMFTFPGCRVCSGRIAVEGINDLATTHPLLMQSWDFERNGEFRPESVTARMNTKVSWVCSIGHTWELPIAFRTNVNGNGKASLCPFCSNQRVLEGFNDLATRHPKVAAEWDYSKNGDATPTSVAFGTPKSYNWKCSRGHEYVSRVVDRTSRGTQCSTCTNQKLLVGFNDLGTTNPMLASQWHPTLNGELTAKDVQGGSGGKAWWLCPLGHAWEAEIRQRNNKDTDCGVCSNLTVLKGFNDLATTHPALLTEWNWELNASVSPTEVVAGAKRRVWWVCSTCSKNWESTIANRTSRKSGCPSCSPGGYDSTMPGLLYFISNDSLRARKIGITNPHAKQDRTREFQVSGWRILKTWTHKDGRLILNLETTLLQKLRGELGLPPFLAKEDMGKSGGWSETFSADAIPDTEVISLIEKQFQEQLQTMK